MNKLKGSNSVILGTDNQNEGDFLFTIGQSNKIKSNNMIVLGTDINSSGQQTTNSQRDFQFIAGSNIGANNTEGTFILGRNSSTFGNSNSHIIGFNSTILHNHNSLIFAKNASISNFNSSVVFGLNISAIRPGINDNNFIYVDEIFFDSYDKLRVCQKENIDVLIDDNDIIYTKLNYNGVKCILFDDKNNYPDIKNKLTDWSNINRFL